MSVETLKTVFDVGTVVLLFLTFAFGAGVLVTGNIINHRQAQQLRKFDEDLTDAKTELGRQQERAAKAEQDAADAKTTAAQTSERATVLEKSALDAKAAQQRVETDLAKQQERTADAEKAASDAALALAKFKQPRTLTREQRERITAKARPFAGMAFDVATSNGKEPLNLVIKIEEALAAAGWKELDWSAGVFIGRTGKPSLGLGAETGVTVQVEIPQESKLLGVAKTIAAALTAEGIAAAAQLMPTPQTENHDAIHIVVGEKPQ
jgi:F0F1-type ATP synthase membrane subunit b/b'